MKQSEFLFALIKSLNSSEKGYFKRMANLHGRTDANYIKLFDAIDEQENYDEQAIKSHFKDEAFTKQFSVAKNYLYKLILRSLEAYHSDIDFEIGSLINQARILFRKTLFKQAGKWLKKAKKLCYKHEKLQFILEINRLEERYFVQVLDVHQMEIEFNKLYEEEYEIHEKLRNSIYYRSQAKNAYFEHLKTGFVGYKGKSLKVEKMLDDERMTQFENCLTKKALLDCYRCHFMYHYMNHEFEKGMTYTGKMLDLIEGNPDVFVDYVSVNTDVIYNHVVQAITLDKLDDAEEYIQKLKAIESGDRLQRVKCFNYVYLLLFSLAIKTKFVKKGPVYLNDFKRELPEFEKYIAPVYSCSLFIFACYISITQEDYKDALNWLEKSKELNDFHSREDLASWIRILELVIHYEMGNFILLESKVRSTYRFLLKQDKLYNVEKAFLHFFKSVSKGLNTVQVNGLFIELKHEIKSAIENPDEKLFIQYLDILVWLDSKIYGEPFEKLLIESIENKTEVQS